MSDSPPALKHYFVDEARDPVLFDAKGRVLVGSEGCSRYFAVGLLDVDDNRKAEYGTYYTKQKPLKAAALKSG
jgi:hypothetical protein